MGDLNVLFTAITTIGFPIVMCVYLVWNGHNREKRETERNDKFAELLTEHRLALVELSQVTRAELANQDEIRGKIADMRETLIRIEQRPCQKGEARLQ